MNAEVLNALMAQNNDLASQIERAEDACQLIKADMAVSFVADLWTALDYEYKLVELRKRISRRAATLARQEEEYLAACRKNDKTRVSTEANLARLNQMAS
jgi:hypothetical protein